MIEWDKFNESFQHFDNDLVIEIIDMFESGYAERIAALQKSVEEKDLKMISFHACYWKGIVANFYDPESTRLSYKLRDMGEDGISEGLPEVFAQLRVASDSLLDELLQYRKTISPVILNFQRGK